jgi:hypothetical protein
VPFSLALGFDCDRERCRKKRKKAAKRRTKAIPPTAAPAIAPTFGPLLEEDELEPGAVSVELPDGTEVEMAARVEVGGAVGKEEEVLVGASDEVVDLSLKTMAINSRFPPLFQVKAYFA